MSDTIKTVELRGIIKSAPRKSIAFGDSDRGVFGFAIAEEGPDIYVPGNVCLKHGIMHDCLGEEWVFTCEPSERDDRGPVAISARREVPAEVTEMLELDDFDKLLLQNIWQLRNMVYTLSSQINAMHRKMNGKD